MLVGGLGVFVGWGTFVEPDVLVGFGVCVPAWVLVKLGVSVATVASIVTVTDGEVISVSVGVDVSVAVPDLPVRVDVAVAEAVSEADGTSGKGVSSIPPLCFAIISKSDNAAGIIPKSSGWLKAIGSTL